MVLQEHIKEKSDLVRSRGPHKGQGGLGLRRSAVDSVDSKLSKATRMALCNDHGDT